LTKRAKDTLQIFAVIFAAVLLLRLLVLGFALVPTRSMMPEILPGDYVFINKMAYSFGVGGLSVELFDIKRNDIVATQTKLVKRAVGMPGDSISKVDGEAYFKISNKYFPAGKLEALNLQIPYEGMTIYCHDIEKFHPFYKQAIEQENPDLIYSTALFDSTDSDLGMVYSYEFKENYFMLLGDNSDYSRDSREFGFVPQSDILGKVEFIYFSAEPQTGELRFDRFFQRL
jgi:signal peptidase I